MEAKKWGIVGGGLMGMTLAENLSKLGHEVTIFEAAPELGGLVSSWKIGSVEWDKFYHVILLSDFHTRNILKEIGLENEIEWVETKTGFYVDGNLYSISNTFEFLKFPALNLIDKFRLGITIIAASKIKNWKKLEKIPVATWLKRWSGKSTYEKIWLPLLRAKLGDSYKKTSAVFIWATIQRLYGARRSGLKKEMFGFVPGGYKTVIKFFRQQLVDHHVSIKTSCPVKTVRTANNGKKTIVQQDGTSFEFDKVIVTLPSPLTAKLCVELTPVEKKKLEDVEYLGVICVAVLLNKGISEFYITNITDSSIPFTGVIEMSALVDPDKYLDGYSLVYLPKYVLSNDPIFNKSDNDIREYFVDNLKKMYSWITENEIKFVGVARARHVITIAKIGYSDYLPAVTTSVPGLYVINTSHIKDGTLNVNETIRVAEIKLTEILN